MNSQFEAADFATIERLRKAGLSAVFPNGCCPRSSSPASGAYSVPAALRPFAGAAKVQHSSGWRWDSVKMKPPHQDLRVGNGVRIGGQSVSSSDYRLIVAEGLRERIPFVGPGGGRGATPVRRVAGLPLESHRLPRAVVQEFRTMRSSGAVADPRRFGAAVLSWKLEKAERIFFGSCLVVSFWFAGVLAGHFSKENLSTDVIYNTSLALVAFSMTSCGSYVARVESKGAGQ